MAEGQESQEVRVLVVGKSGSGKSTVSNKLAGRQAFPRSTGRLEDPLRAASSVTRSVTRDGKDILLRVTDTPDVFSTGQSEEEVSPHLGRIQELTAAAPPHAVLLTIRCDQRYSKADHKFYEELRKSLSDVIQNNLVLAFTHGERLRVGETIESVVGRVGSYLKEVYDHAGGRYLVFEGEECFEVANQLDLLLDFVAKIEEAKGGSCALM